MPNKFYSKHKREINKKKTFFVKLYKAEKWPKKQKSKSKRTQRAKKKQHLKQMPA